MSQDDEAFLSRWSRKKREQRLEAQKPAEAQKPQPEAPAPALPSVETLTPQSDFTGFMHPKVEDSLRRVALKKLFSDPHFNIPDPFEAYSGDWTGGEPIPPELLATLNQARTVLLSPEERDKLEQEEREQARQAQAQEAAQEGQPQQGELTQDEPGRKDA